MSDENLGDVLNNSMLSYMKDSAIKHLVSRPHLRLGQIVKLCEHPEQGAVISEISLQDIVDAALSEEEGADEELNALMEDLEELEEKTLADEEEEGRTKTAKKRAKKKLAKKASPTKKAAKKTKKVSKASKKKGVAKKTSSKKGAAKDKKPKADKGKPKPRLDYDRGMKEVLAALKAAGGPCGRKTLENATGYSAVQIRTFAKKLEDRGKISISGSGRNTQYERT